jgi:hypothetical protein
MKSKLTLLLTALTFSGLVATATAGPDMLTQALRKQIADSHRTAQVAVVDSGPVHYVASPSGKGGTVVERKDGGTSIAVFKSKSAHMKACSDSACCAKKDCEDASCCSKSKAHKH